MRSDYLNRVLRFCCIIDDAAAGHSLTEQAEMALKAGATMIRYNTSGFSSDKWDELQSLCRLCQSNGVPFVVKDHYLLSKALCADGIHIENSREHPEIIRRILGPEALIGKTCATRPGATPEDISSCDYIELIPFHPDSGCTPASAGGISNRKAAEQALGLGASGITAAHSVFQSETPTEILRTLGKVAGCAPRPEPAVPWRDEFGLIEKILGQAPKIQDGLIVPPGDDACLLAPLSRPVISTDTQKEGVHFRLDWQSPEEIGEKAVSVTLSDLAASYAHPVSLFINLSIPPRISDALVEDLYRGIGRALAGYGCSLGGGNISASTNLSLDLFAIGQGREDIFPKRSEAKPGFGLYATGPLGVARAGLEALFQNDSDFPELVHRFKHPRARFDAADILAAHGVTCVMDLSDGLSGDAAHMAEASNLTIDLDVSTHPWPESLISFCRKYKQTPKAFALAGGEDYELLFACSPEAFYAIQTLLPESVRVGRCLPFQGRHIISPDITISSYRHGA